MIRGKTVSLIIPARNEEKGLGQLLKSVPNFVDEVIVVDNGSTDATPEIAREAGATVISENRTLNGIGYGFAHLSGMKRARGDYLVTMDADNTYPLEEIKNILNTMLDNNINFISCTRFPLIDSRSISLIRRLGVKLLNLEVFILYGFKIQDILTGMWAMDRKALRYLHLRMGDWNLSPEIKLSAIVNPKIKFAEYHINHFGRIGQSEQRIWGTGLSHMLYILKRRFTQDLSYHGFIAPFRKRMIYNKNLSM